jgi:hypothetical protein
MHHAFGNVYDDGEAAAHNLTNRPPASADLSRKHSPAAFPIIRPFRMRTDIPIRRNFYFFLIILTGLDLYQPCTIASGDLHSDSSFNTLLYYNWTHGQALASQQQGEGKRREWILFHDVAFQEESFHRASLHGVST